MIIERALQGETLDAVIWRLYGRLALGHVEACLALEANRHLSAAAVILPLGTPVHIIEPQDLSQSVAANPTRLWQ